MKDPGDRGDVGCRFRFSVDVFELDADALGLRQPRALGVLNVQQLGLDQAGDGPISIHRGRWRERDTDGCVIAGEQG